MSQEITVTRTEDHWTMQFGDSDTEYPVPEHAIDSLDDDLVPEEEGEGVTFVGEYKGVKHMKNFDVEDVIKAPGDDDEDSEDDTEPDEETESDEFDRIETTDEAPGVDTATVEPGDVLELVSGEPGSEGDRFRVLDIERGFGDGGSLVVEPTEGTESRRDKIVDNGSGPMFNPVMEDDR